MSSPAVDCSQARLEPDQDLEPSTSLRDGGVSTSAAHNGEDDSSAESDDSSSTQEESVETILAEAEAARQQKMRLGGRPTRTIKEYRPEDVNLIPMADDHPRAKLYRGPARPIPQRTVPWETTLYRTYCAEERMHFRSELLAWESFLRSIRRDWVRRDEAAGGTVPPPPPVLEWDPLDLHTRYLEFLNNIRTNDENGHDDITIISRFNFWPYHVFVHHIEEVERQVEQIRDGRSLPDHPGTAGADQEQSRLTQTKTQPNACSSTNARESHVSQPPSLAPQLTSTEFQNAISLLPNGGWPGSTAGKIEARVKRKVTESDESAQSEKHNASIPGEVEKGAQPKAECDGKPLERKTSHFKGSNKSGVAAKPSSGRTPRKAARVVKRQRRKNSEQPVKFLRRSARIADVKAKEAREK